MSILRIINRPGSHAARVIREKTGINRYTGIIKGKIDAIVNYGLSGNSLSSFLHRFPSARRTPILNGHIETSKLRALRLAERNGIRVPESKVSLAARDNLKEWIEKRYASEGGRGIRMATRKNEIPGKYFQKFISKRPFEIRIHAFKWLPKESWAVQKRIGRMDEVAWNHEQGGVFVTVHNPRSYRTYTEALSVSQKILDLMDMQFGAVDFVVDEKFQIYFIEINSAPGFSELSEHIYVNAFNKLKEMTPAKVSELTK